MATPYNPFQYFDLKKPVFVHFSILYDFFTCYFALIYFTLAGSTRRCPGHYIKMIKCIVRAKVARKVSPKVLHLLFNKLCLKMTDHGSRSTWGPGPSGSGLRDQKYDLLPLKQTFPTTFVL
jgi:hypothetical protein